MSDAPALPADDLAVPWTAIEAVVGIGCLHHDLGTGRARWSPTLHRLLGVAVDDRADPKVFGSLVQATARRAALSGRSELWTDPPPVDVEWRHADGRWRTFECRGVCRLDADGRPVDVVATVQDVTEVRDEITRLQASELRARHLVAAMPDALVMVDAEGRIEEVNEQAVALFGYPSEELVGRPVEVLVPAERHADHRRYRSSWNAPPRTPMSTGGPVLAVGRDGRQIPVEVNVTTLPLDGRRLTIASIRDVTESRRLHQQLKDATRLYSGMLDAVTQQAIIATTEDGLITVFNPGAVHLLGYAEAELIGRSPVALYEPGTLSDDGTVEGAAPGFETIVAEARAGRPSVHEWTWRTRSGGVLTVSVSVSAMRDGDAIAGFILIGQDVTDRRRAEIGLRDSEERFRLGFDNAIVGMKMVGLRPGEVGTILRANPAMCAFLGYTERDLLGRTVQEMTHPDDGAAVAEQLRRLRSGETASIRVERRYRHAAGHVLWGLVSVSLVRPSQGEPYLLDMVEDVTARKEAEAALTHRALHDALTGLPNREMLSDHLAQALSRARRTGDVVGVLFLDLDDFKEINDTLGHEAGDECLVEVARLVRGSLRDADTAARLGGDEFVVICEDLHRADEVHRVVARLQEALRDELTLRRGRIRLSASIGVALSTPTSTPSTMLRDADAAMYAAKEQGNGRYELADVALQARATRLLTVESELAAALDENQLVLHYQPCLDLGTGRLIAVEALLRWQHPERGLLAPAAFLDVVEASDLNDRIGAWVLRTAIDQAAAWARDGRRNHPDMWVNINSRQLGNADQLSSVIAEALAVTGLAPGRLCVELTERQALGALRSVRDDLREITGLGVRLAIDDFGTGHNGLSHLRELPVDTIKIDKSYIDGIGVDRTDTALISSILTLGANLDIDVVAEGVETAGQRDRLRDLGCRLAQGYLLARPAPAAEVGAGLS